MYFLISIAILLQIVNHIRMTGIKNQLDEIEDMMDYIRHNMKSKNKY